MPQVGSVGERVDLHVKQGAVFGPFEWQLTNPDDTPTNLAGCSFFGDIRERADSPQVIGSLTFTVVNAAQGIFKMGMPELVTNALPVLVQPQISRPRRFVWDAFLRDSLGVAHALMYGEVIYEPRVSALV
jgi:hypothetical protein